VSVLNVSDFTQQVSDLVESQQTPVESHLGASPSGAEVPQEVNNVMTLKNNTNFFIFIVF
jgi:hypothetical protein